MYNIAIQHGEGRTCWVFRGTTLRFRTLGSRESVCYEIAECVKRLVAAGPAAGLEQSIEGEAVAYETLARYAYK